MSSKARAIADVLAEPRARLALLAVAAALILFARLGQGHLANYDDCYYAEKAKEMLNGGDWLTPHFAGNIRLDNPPLFLWLIAAGFTLFGVGGYGAAFFSAAAGVGAVLLLVRVARRHGFDDFTSWSAGVILLTTPYFLKYAGHAMMDVVLALFFLAAVDGYLSGCEGRRLGWIQLGVATGLGILMKSVLGVFPLAVVAVHRLSVRRAKGLTDSGLWLAAVTAVVIGAPWFGYQFAVHRELLMTEHFRWLIWSRGFVEPAVGGGSDPFGYLTRIAKVYWPWLPLALMGSWLTVKRLLDPARDPEERASAGLIAAWLVIVVGTMSLGHVKKLWYVMSVFPCLALLAAMAAGEILRSETARRRAMAWASAVIAAFAAVVALTPIGTSRPRQPDLQEMARAVRANVPPGNKVINLDEPYWDVANQFLFYSDHDLTEPLGDPARVRDALRDGGWALIPTRRIAEVVGDDQAAVSVVARSGVWSLMTSAPSPPLILRP